jgi:hypothetical protein
MNNPYGLVLDDASLRWAAAESVPETVIAAICLLETRRVDEIVARLTPAELELVIKIVGRCPRGYPPGAYEALKGHRRSPSPKPQPAERINPGPERLQRRSKKTDRTAEHTPPWTSAPRSAMDRASTNAYGITLNHAWTEWAAEHSVSETIAAALYLVSTNRKVGEVVVKLTPGEMERVIAFVQHWPDHFAPGALLALKNSRTTLPPEPSAAHTFAGVGHTSSFARVDPETERVYPTRGRAQRRAAFPSATEHVTVPSDEKSGTRAGTLAETARRRMAVEDLMGAGLSVRTISAGTGIPRSSVHRAMRAITRAEAKKEVALAEIAKALLGKKLRSRAKSL